MIVATLAPAALGQAPKPTTSEDPKHDLTRIKNIDAFLRKERGMSRRNAEKIARQCLRNPGIAREYLPSGWAVTLHPELSPKSYRREYIPSSPLMTPRQHATWLAYGGDRLV